MIDKGKKRGSWKYTIGRKIKTAVNWLKVSYMMIWDEDFRKSLYTVMSGRVRGVFLNWCLWQGEPCEKGKQFSFVSFGFTV